MTGLRRDGSSLSAISLRASVKVLALTIACAMALLAQTGYAQTYTVVHSFTGGPTDGALANGDLVQDTAGNLYGTTQEGGTNNYGTVFKLDPSDMVTILYNFTNGADGGLPDAGLFLDTTGDLYGTTSQGGSSGLGTVFKLDTNNVLTTLHSFKGGSDGASPFSGLVSIDGTLYGTTSHGGSSKCDDTGCGTIFKITKGGLKTILYRFDGGINGGAEGAYPWGLIRDPAGNLYGVAASGGAHGAGTVFKLDTAGVFTVLYTFTGSTDGGNPQGRLIRDTNGNIHGTTVLGGAGACGCGVVFRLDTSGHETVLHSFFDYGGGALPYTDPIDVDGTLYGTTVAGGDLSCFRPNHGCGLLYQIGKTGQYTVLHRFAGAAVGDGAFNSIGGLTPGTGGSIYGVTVSGGTGTDCRLGASGCGTIFKYTP